MAYTTSIFCVDCGESKTVIVGASGTPDVVCGECKQCKETERREKYFAELNELPIEERIRRIEEWQYDYRPQYVPPPRF